MNFIVTTGIGNVDSKYEFIKCDELSTIYLNRGITGDVYKQDSSGNIPVGNVPIEIGFITSDHQQRNININRDATFKLGGDDFLLSVDHSEFSNSDHIRSAIFESIDISTIHLETSPGITFPLLKFFNNGSDETLMLNGSDKWIVELSDEHVSNIKRAYSVKMMYNVKNQLNEFNKYIKFIDFVENGGNGGEVERSIANTCNEHLDRLVQPIIRDKSLIIRDNVAGAINFNHSVREVLLNLLTTIAFMSSERRQRHASVIDKISNSNGGDIVENLKLLLTSEFEYLEDLSIKLEANHG